jgi:hypothetical protein
MDCRNTEENAVIANSGNIFADARVRLDQRVFNLDPETFAQMQFMLDAPPHDNPKLRRLMATKAPWEAGVTIHSIIHGFSSRSGISSWITCPSAFSNIAVLRRRKRGRL